MTAVQDPAPLVARSYTRARRHPWVLGRVGDWTLPLGPYTPAQLVVAGAGAMVLIETYSLWADALGPLPVFALGAGVWAVRSARIGGRVPAAALLGLLSAALEPRSGRIGARAARDGGPIALVSGFHVTDTDAESDVAVRSAPRDPVPDVQAPRHSYPTPRSPASAVPQTALQRLLASCPDQP